MNASHGRTKLDVRTADIARRYADLTIEHWRTLSILACIGWPAFALFGYLQDTLLGWRPDDFMTFFDLDVFPVAFITAASAHAVLWGSPGPRTRDALDVAMRAFGSVLAVTLLVRLAVVLGLVFLILPGLALVILLGLSAVIMLAERPSVFGSLRQSFTMVLSAIGPVIGGYIVYLLSLALILVAALFVVAIVTMGVPDPLGGHIQDGAMSALLSVSHTVFAVAIYQVLTEARAGNRAEAFN